MSKKVTWVLLLAGLIALYFGYVSTKNQELTSANFPKQVGGYERVNLREDAETKQASGTFLGVKEKIKKTFMSNFKAPGAVVTLFVLIPEDKTKEVLVAQQLAENMAKQNGMFSNFTTLSLYGGKPIVNFSGPMDKMQNYVFYKNGKIFWMEVLTQGDARKTLDVFYNQF